MNDGLFELQSALAAHQRRAAAAIEAGVPALRRLMPLAERGEGSHARRIAAFLAGLYNGPRFPFDLTDLRGLDAPVVDDVLAVLRMDAVACEQEVHRYFEQGGERFEGFIAKWGLDRREGAQ